MTAPGDIPRLLRDPRLRTFRELDQRHRRPKGTAFRAFKGALPRLVEGRHFHYIDARSAAPWIPALRREGRVYRSTTHLVLITPEGDAHLRAALEGGAAP